MFGMFNPASAVTSKLKLYFFISERFDNLLEVFRFWRIFSEFEPWPEAINNLAGDHFQLQKFSVFIAAPFSG